MPGRETEKVSRPGFCELVHLSSSISRRYCKKISALQLKSDCDYHSRAVLANVPAMRDIDFRCVLLYNIPRTLYDAMEDIV